MKVVEYLLRTLELNGVRRIFGNPGTTEIPLVRACEGRRAIRYVVALSEVAAAPMADGYARATRSLGVVNLHVAPGLGNGMGALYTAGISSTPLLALIGGQDRRFLHTHPILWGPLEKMADSVCKAVFALGSSHDAAANIRRALRAALSPPRAPVALICPPDLLEESIAGKPALVQPPRLGALDATDAERYAAFLTGAKRPAVIAAEDVYWSGAQDALETLSDRVHAPIYVAPYTGVLPIASTARAYAGYLPPSMTQIAERLAGHDALLMVGGRGFRTTLYSDAKLTQRKAWLGYDASVNAPDGEFDCACVADPRAALAVILRRLPARKKHARARLSTRAALKLPSTRPGLHPTRAIHALLDHFAEALWIDESGLSTSDVRQWMKLPAGRYLVNGSGGIGWGLPAAVGAAIGKPDGQVVALIGDGSALYASEAMWSAAHHGTRMVLVILSNRRYATLNEAAHRLGAGALRAFTLEPPVMDFGGLATLYGWDYAAASTEAALRSILNDLPRRVAANTLLELRLDPEIKPLTASRHF